MLKNIITLTSSSGSHTLRIYAISVCDIQNDMPPITKPRSSTAEHDKNLSHEIQQLSFYTQWMCLFTREQRSGVAQKVTRYVFPNHLQQSMHFAWSGACEILSHSDHILEHPSDILFNTA